MKNKLTILIFLILFSSCSSDDSSGKADLKITRNGASSFYKCSVTAGFNLDNIWSHFIEGSDLKNTSEKVTFDVPIDITGEYNLTFLEFFNNTVSSNDEYYIVEMMGNVSENTPEIIKGGFNATLRNFDNEEMSVTGDYTIYH